ncbi:hypothetical protein BRCON_2677 [Candidatus Sumerlaea chitinivorans]|uniref:SGNH hydrolase-type esterase domain-containing protein n=1 Tax=Sumerlaea chitinivorans TaxID=2250252 RepID=A0A2Z4Y960_SUMC1|nr:hypothetical protein BRCON_2677 [Candidatus Sumerlaea chitinivorans]
MKSFALRNLSAILSLVLLLGLSATAFDVSAQSTAVTTQSLSKKSVSTTVTMWSRALGRETTYTVIMPAERQPDTRYPVLYLLHGAYGSYRDWPEKTALLDYAAGRPLLIVCPDGGEFGWYVDSPPNNNYETFLTQELIADVEARFPALPKREARGICGLSMGGHGALSLAAKHPELFCSASAMSGILCLTNHPGKWHLDDRFGPLNEQNDARWRAHSVADLVDRFTTAGIALYFDVGTSDATGAVADNRLVHERLANRGIAHTYAEFEGGHTWRYWDWRISAHLRFHLDRFNELRSGSASPSAVGAVFTDNLHRHYSKRCLAFEAENAKWRKASTTSRPIVLLGSSSIEGLKERQLFPNYVMVNRGISGDRIGIGDRGILHRLECSVFALRPRAVFILNGTNDLSATARTGSPKISEIVATYAEVVARICKEVPDAKIFIVSCTPTRDAYAYISPLIPKFNAEVAKLANGQDPAIYYVDTYSDCVGTDGLLREELSRDGLHLNAAGYEIVKARFLEAMAKANIQPDLP